MAARPSTGRRITVKKLPITVRDLIRRHLREEGWRIGYELAAALNIQKCSAYDFMTDGRIVTPQQVDAVIQYMKLDVFDANELRKRGAIEAGWQIDFQLEDIPE